MLINFLVENPLLYFRIIVIVIISVCLHELAHGFAAINQGDDTPIRKGHMTPNPVIHMGWPSLIILCFAGIAWGQMPVNPEKFRSQKWGSILVSAAGPLLNLGLAFLAIAALALVSQQNLQNVISLTFFLLIARFNLVLFLFNLLPIPPLDGFHVISECLPSLKPLKNSPLGMAALMILFVTGASSALFTFSDTIVQALLDATNSGLVLR